MYKAIESLIKKKGKGIAAIILCDGGERYLDTVFNDEWMNKNHLMDDCISRNLRDWLRGMNNGLISMGKRSI